MPRTDTFVGVFGRRVAGRCCRPYKARPSTERCRSGRSGRSRKPFYPYGVPWVRIPPSPPDILITALIQLDIYGKAAFLPPRLPPSEPRRAGQPGSALLPVAALGRYGKASPPKAERMPPERSAKGRLTLAASGLWARSDATPPPSFQKSQHSRVLLPSKCASLCEFSRILWA